MNARLAAIATQHPDKVRQAYVDTDGAWIDLKAGWCVPEGAAIVHGIVQPTVGRALQTFTQVRRCTCQGCLKELATGHPAK